MSEQINNEPAFPRTYNADGHNGMTLRDYFAAKASDKDIKAALAFGESWENTYDRCTARFRHADAMLAAREAKS